EHVAEHRSRAKGTLWLRAEMIEPLLHHRQHRVWKVGVPFGDRADELLEEERVPGGSLDDSLYRARSDVCAENVLDEPFARLSRQAGQPDLLQLAVAP